LPSFPQVIGFFAIRDLVSQLAKPADTFIVEILLQCLAQSRQSGVVLDGSGAQARAELLSWLMR
jgi:hypothetical protein